MLVMVIGSALSVVVYSTVKVLAGIVVVPMLMDRESEVTVS